MEARASMNVRGGEWERQHPISVDRAQRLHARRPKTPYERRVKRWVLANAIGEAGAMLLTALFGALFSMVPAEGFGLVLLPVLMILMGVLEGALIGAAQATVLDVARGRWTALTAAAFGVAWALGALASMFEPSSAPSKGTVLLFAGCAGAILGTLVGFAQRRIASDPSHVGRMAVGWGCSMILTAIAADFVPHGPMGVPALAINMGGGALAGGLVGLVSWDSVSSLATRNKK